MNTGALTLLVLSLLARQTAATETIHPLPASPKGRFYAPPSMTASACRRYAGGCTA